MQLVNIPLKMPTVWAANAGAAYIRTVPNASQIGKVNGAASWADGFPPLNFTAVAAGGIPPFGKDANGALQQISAWNRWQQAGGPIRHDGSFQASIGGYPKEARVGSNTTPFMVWQSTIDNNLSNPDTGGAGWQPPLYPDVSFTGQTTPTPAFTIAAANPSAVNSNGAGFGLIGNGTITPRKWIRVANGNFAVVNNAYTAEILTLNDAGDLSNLRNITANGDITLGDDLIVGDALTVVGNATFGGTAAVTGDMTVGDDLSVLDDLTVGGELLVGGDGQVTGDLHVLTGLYVTGNAVVSGSGKVASLMVGNIANPGAGRAAIQYTLATGADAAIGDYLQVGGNIYVGPDSSKSTLAYIAFKNLAPATTIFDGYIRKDFVNHNITINVSNPGGTAVPNPTNVVTIDANGSLWTGGNLTARGDVFAGYGTGGNNNSSVIRFRTSAGDTSGTGYIFRNNDSAGTNPNSIIISSVNTPNIGIAIDSNGNLKVSGTIVSNSVSLLDAITALSDRLAALGG